MASKRRLRRKACDGKVRYETKHDAEQAMYKLINSGKKYPGYIDTYRCHFCHGFHFGHRKVHRGAYQREFNKLLGAMT